MSSYYVRKLRHPIQPDARWEKSPWNQIPSVKLTHHMGELPAHFPEVDIRLAYDDKVLYLIFRVDDRFVCTRKSSYQDRVCEDSCVEFFFTPGEDRSMGYFNLEVNCGGTAFFHHQ